MARSGNTVYFTYLNHFQNHVRIVRCERTIIWHSEEDAGRCSTLFQSQTLLQAVHSEIKHLHDFFAGMEIKSINRTLHDYILYDTFLLKVSYQWGQFVWQYVKASDIHLSFTSIHFMATCFCSFTHLGAYIRKPKSKQHPTLCLKKLHPYPCVCFCNCQSHILLDLPDSVSCLKSATS